MPETNAHFEPVAWWYTRKKIGRDLAQHYELTDDLPPRLLALISEIGVIAHEIAGVQFFDRPRRWEAASSARPPDVAGRDSTNSKAVGGTPSASNNPFCDHRID